MVMFAGNGSANALTGTDLDDEIRGLGGDDILDGLAGDDMINGGDGNDTLFGGLGADTFAGGRGDDVAEGGDGDDLIQGNAGNDVLSGDTGNDSIKGDSGNDTLYGGDGDDQLTGGRDDDDVYGGAGNDLLFGNAGDDQLYGGDGADDLSAHHGNDALYGGDGDDILSGGDDSDTLEGGAGTDTLLGGNGDDQLLAFSWAGEPVPAQDASAQVNAGEPVADDDILTGGDGADVFEFRWLIDAKDEIIEKHRDADGDVDYSMNGVAGENDNAHDHWVESMGIKTVTDFDAAEGDQLVFEGHTVQFDGVEHTDIDANGTLDSVLSFVSNQGGNGGAHDGDEVGTVVILNNLIVDVDVDAGVFYGVEDTDSIIG